MGLFDIFKKKPAPAQKTVSEEPARRECSDSEIEALVNYIKEKTKQQIIRIRTTETTEYGIADSRFGGYPYWENRDSYPCNSAGNPLVLLAQINFAEIDIKNDRLPESGLLQFFISDDDLIGLNFDDQTNQDTFRVVYHETVNHDVTLESVMEMNIPVNTADSDDWYLPFIKVYSLSFSEETDFINGSDQNLEEILRDAIYAVFGEKYEGLSFRYMSDSSFDKIFEKLGSWGHKILGYPQFTQADPRIDVEAYDTLLLQIDSDNKDIMWGDSGVCNFFINSEKLKNLDFTDVLYNWDCY